MARCTSQRYLVVHHRKDECDNSLDNAEVLCDRCHAQILMDEGDFRDSLPAFSKEVKIAAKIRAEYQCECERIEHEWHQDIHE